MVGVVATKAQWSTDLRSYLADHVQAVSVEIILDRAALERAIPRLDVLVLDDVMRLLTGADIMRATEAGVHVVGVQDPDGGRGEQFLRQIGAQQLMSAEVRPHEVASALLSLRPKDRLNERHPYLSPWSPGPANLRYLDGQRGRLSVWTRVSGGCGLTEAVIAAAQYLSKRSRVILIELNDLAPVIATRLLRSLDGGLALAVARASVGLDSAVEGLAGPRPDGVHPLGAFDAICVTPGHSAGIGATGFMKLVRLARKLYGHVLIEAPCIPMLGGEREPASAGSLALAEADAVVVMSAADPTSAVRLVEWRARAAAIPVTADCVAAFGRCHSNRYERAHLRSILMNHTEEWPFRSAAFLPEDEVVRRARWNNELVWKGRWLREIQALAQSIDTPDVLVSR